MQDILLRQDLEGVQLAQSYLGIVKHRSRYEVAYNMYLPAMTVAMHTCVYIATFCNS